MDKLYLIEGDNEFLIQEEINKIKKNKKLEEIKFDLSESSIDNVIETLDTFDMFGNQKLVIASNPPFYSNVDDNFSYDKFLKYLKNPSDNILIIISKKINKKLKLVKDTINYFKYIEIKELNPINFVKNNLDGFNMDNMTINYLLNRIGNNYNNIYNELNKLKLLTYDKKIITKEDIDLICKRNIQDSIFDLIDAIIKKEKEKIVLLYNHFINNGTEVFGMLIMLANQIRLIYNVKVLYNLRDSDIASILDVKEYPVKLARSKGLNYSKKELLDLLYNLGEMDEDIKSGKVLPNISFLSFLMQM